MERTENVKDDGKEGWVEKDKEAERDTVKVGESILAAAAM